MTSLPRENLPLSSCGSWGTKDGTGQAGDGKGATKIIKVSRELPDYYTRVILALHPQRQWE